MFEVARGCSWRRQGNWMEGPGRARRLPLDHVPSTRVLVVGSGTLPTFERGTTGLGSATRLLLYNQVLLLVFTVFCVNYTFGIYLFKV